MKKGMRVGGKENGNWQTRMRKLKESRVLAGILNGGKKVTWKKKKKKKKRHMKKNI